jgi:hypothetical protein
MTSRTILTALAVAVGVAAAVVGCGTMAASVDHGSDAGSGSSGAASGSGNSGTSSGSSATGSSDAGAAGASCDAGLSVTAAPLGAPCVSEEEGYSSFGGFSPMGISVDSNTFACASRICLINHFQGRVTCPYGQTAPGVGPDGGPGCVTPGTCAPVNPVSGPTVPPQCSNRQAADAVYCSCRCANTNGGTDDAGTYCTCPSDMTCTQLVPSIGGANQGLTGAYCIKAGTVYDAGADCSKCDPTTAPCP